jgi:hypothetical protein
MYGSSFYDVWRSLEIPWTDQRRSSRLHGTISPSYRKEESNGEEARTTHRDIEEGGSAQRIKNTLSQVRTETCADTWSLWLDHAHGAGQLESRSDKGVVHGGPWLDVQAELSDAEW